MCPKPCRLPLAAAFAATALAACAAAPAAGGGMRVLVRLAQPSNDPAAIAALAARVSGHEAHYAASAGGDWHALMIRCRGADDCDAALRRLAEDGTDIAAAQRDARKAIVTP